MSDNHMTDLASQFQINQTGDTESVCRVTSVPPTNSAFQAGLNISTRVSATHQSLGESEMPEFIGAVNPSEMVAEPINISKESASGFMLLSVGRLSKVRRGSPTAPASVCFREVVDELYCNNGLRASFGDDPRSSTGDPHPPRNDELVHGEFYGSVEAEEFEDDGSSSSHDADDGIIEDDFTVVDDLSRFRDESSYVGLDVHSAPLVANWSSVNVLTEQSGTVTPRPRLNPNRPGCVLSLGRLLPSELIRAPHDFSYLNGHHLSDQRSHFEQCLLGLPHYNSKSVKNVLDVLMVDVHAQRNNSHHDSQVVSHPLLTANLSVHTAPVSNHVSPPVAEVQPIHPESSSLPESCPMNDDTSVPHSPFPRDSKSIPETSSMLHQHHSRHAASGGPIISCLHYLRSGGLSDSLPPTQLLVSTDANQLASSDAVLSATSLPPLQPASRFRKARIHETVEQWSNGRASIHDCHLRTVPEWVTEIQKKPGVSGQESVVAVDQKINCSSCLKLILLGPHLPDQHSTRRCIAPKSISLSNPLSSGHPRSSSVNASKIMLDCGSGKAHVLAFWDGGSRVQSWLPRRDRKCPCSTGVELPVTEQRNHDAGACLLCTDFSLTQRDVGSTSNCGNAQSRDATHFGDCSDLLRKGQPEYNVTFQPGFHRNAIDAIPTNVATLQSNLSLRTGLVPSDSSDPATAYLRHLKIETIHDTAVSSACSEAFTKRDGSSPADFHSLVQPEDSQLAPDSVGLPENFLSYSSSVNNAPPPVLPLNDSAPGGTTNTQNLPEPMLAAKLLNAVITGPVPPTSPTFVDNTGHQTRPSVASSHEVPVAVDYVKGVLLNGVHPRIEHGAPSGSVPTEYDATDFRTHMSGSYHNMAHWDCCHPADTDGDSRDCSFTKPLSSPTSLSTSFHSALAHVQEVILKEHMITGNHQNGPVLTEDCHPQMHLTQGTRDNVSSLRSVMSHHGLHYPESPTVLPPSKLTQRQDFDDSTYPVGLEARISRSMDVIRSAMESAFQRELAAVHAENVRLSTEVQRLGREVSALRGYQTAFYALRPFVVPGIWDRLHEEQFQPFKRRAHDSLPPTTSVSAVTSQLPFNSQPEPHKDD